LHVRWRWEREPLGTAGALHCIDDLEESLLVVNGDVVTDLDPRDMMAFHHGRGAALTIATRTTVVETELGVIEHQQGAVTGYREKPVLHYAASMGVYCYEPHVIAGLASEPVQFPDLVVKLLAHGEVVSAYLTDASWSHIGTQAQHAEAVRLLADDPARDWLD
jgi:NDP-sugar pyrophosphorylase family protein